ncbi:MAG: CocE/NonD family hydrolase [Aliifodinibius sp.]|nr:CocE/NonD family hydrolase [Fodinibius sp.]NIY27809.1 CocE/NonD family hydrolase [Fodinibius sp.]
MGVFEGGAALLDEAVEWFMEKGGAKYKHEHGMGHHASRDDLMSLPVIGMIDRCDGPSTDWDEMPAHDISDTWWKRFNGVSDNDSIHIPALYIDSWFDYGVAETLFMCNLFQHNAPNQTSRNNQYCIIYPTKHCCFGDATDSMYVDGLFLGDARLDNFAVYLKWCDYWLKKKENSIFDMPRIQYYVMGKNVWRQADEWPPAEVVFKQFDLTGHQDASDVKVQQTLALSRGRNIDLTTIVYDPEDPAPSYAWPGEVNDDLLRGRPDILIFESINLEKPIEVTGPVVLVLYVSSSAKDTDFIARLLDVTPDGKTHLLTQGSLRMRFRQGFDREVFMARDSVYKVEINLKATSYVFSAGHKIRLDISSSDFPRLTRNLNTGGDNYQDTVWTTAVNKIYHSKEYPSHLTLPVMLQY